MHWNKIKRQHYFKEPVEYIHATAIVDTPEYDKLYENQNNLEHQIWKDFYEKYKINFNFYKNLHEFDKDKKIICLWFFKDRGDKNIGNDLELEGKIIKYIPNTFLITKSKNIKIFDRKSILPDRPILQLDLSEKEYDKIIIMIRQLIRDLPR